MITYCVANPKDIPQIVDIFFDSFSDLIRRRYGGLPSKKAVKDIMVLYIDAAQDGFIVAKESDKIVGYVIAVENLRKPWGALFTKHILKLPLFLVPPRIFFVSAPTFWHFFVGAHIVTEAVSPNIRGKGVGTKLAKLIVEYLEQKKVGLVHFETEANNEPIKKIYSKLGFKEGKKFRTGKIHWLTMSKDFRAARAK